MGWLIDWLIDWFNGIQSMAQNPEATGKKQNVVAVVLNLISTGK